MSPLFHSTGLEFSMAVVMDQAKVYNGAELVSTILNLREIELPDFTKDPNNIAPVILPGIGVKQEGHESDVDVPPVVCEPPLSHETGKDSDKEGDKENDMESEIADSTGGSQRHEPAALEPVMDASDGKDNETAKDGKEFEMEVKDGKDNETAKDGKEREMEVKDGKDNETAQDGKEHEMEVKDGKDNGTAKDGKEREMEAKDNNDNETAQAGKEREMEAKEPRLAMSVRGRSRMARALWTPRMARMVAWAHRWKLSKLRLRLSRHLLPLPFLSLKRESMLMWIRKRRKTKIRVPLRKRIRKIRSKRKVVTQQNSGLWLSLCRETVVVRQKKSMAYGCGSCTM